MITANELDKYVKLYETKEFIQDDPVQFPHNYIKKEDIEISGFLASIFAYGKRELFIKVLKDLFSQMNNRPFDFIVNCEINTIKNIDYRFSKNVDLIQILKILKKLYAQDNSSLEELFSYGWSQENSVKKMLKIVADYFYSNVNNEITDGFYHLIPNPDNNSPLKRMNMFLRWMIRKSEVDFGLWKFMPTSELLIPLDVHSARISRNIGLLTRKSNDLKAVIELTNCLKKFDNSDPVKYDFALFGYGVNHNNL